MIPMITKHYLSTLPEDYNIDSFHHLKQNIKIAVKSSTNLCVLLFSGNEGSTSTLLDEVVRLTAELRPGQAGGQVGPVIDMEAKQRYD
jgi:hypothetical protein